MARNDDSKRDDGTPSRVFKSSDVHKRRVDRKGREKQQSSPSPERESAEGSPAASEGSSREAVVITPQFGKRTQAQRDADDRWFAAMRDADAPAEALGDLNRKPDETAPLGPLQDQKAQAAPKAQGPQEASSHEAAPERHEAAGAVEPAAEQAAGETPASEPAPEGPSAEVSAEKPAPESPAGEKDAPKRRPSLRPAIPGKHRIALVIVAVVVIAIAVAAALFTWNRWYRYDDHADLQGQWYVVGTTVPVTIDDKAIHLTDDVTYQYEIDTQSKTLKYTFGQMEGQGRYWFSDDRQYLVITDGDEFTSASTAFDDLLRSFTDFADKVSGNELRLPEGEGIIAFSREPDAEALAREEAEAAAKAQAEEAARKEKERKEAEEAAALEAEWEEYYYYDEDEGGSTEEAPAEEAPSEETPAEEE